MNWILYVLSPVMVHLLLSEGIAVLAGTVIDSAACTALSSVVVLPVAIWMYRRDGSYRGDESYRREGSYRGDGSLRRRPFHSESEGKTFALSRMNYILKENTWEGKLGPLFFLGCLAGGGLLNLLWSGLMKELGITGHFSNRAQEALLTSGMAMQLLGPGLLVPIAEELVFRGLCYTRMKTRLSVGQSVFFSALLFALYHGNPIQMIYAFPMALILALLYERGGTLTGPVLFHMGANLAAILLA
ncbi:MAG: CPBP family intramembrane metalloprotease [Lachnospiraceae bacterium]|nr:CPBP family intramembrane metalloprotease [Lachnospiraceae bacterium]